MAFKREVRKQPSDDPKLSKIKSLLTSDEEYITHYKAGFYTIVESDKRLTIMRRWPRVFLKMPFNEIRRLEYFTKIDWPNLLKLIIYSCISVFLMFRPALLWEKVIGFYFPFMLKLLSLDKPFDYVVISYLVMLFFYLLALIALVKFVGWLIGRLTIESSKRVDPLEIICQFSDDVKALMTEVEAKIRKKE